MRTWAVRSLLVSCACMAAALMVACGGGGSSAPNAIFVTPTPSSSPAAAPIAPGSSLSATGSQGVTFSFSFGNGVPGGETALIAPHALPTPYPSVKPGTPMSFPTDELSIAVGPSPLALSAIASFAFSGLPATVSPYSVYLIDTTNPQAWTAFNTTRSGGPLVLANSGPFAPVTTLQPGREYLLQLWPYRAPVFPPGASPFPSNGTMGYLDSATGNGLYLQFTGQAPADEWYTFQGGPPPGTGTLVNTYIDGFTMTIGPSPLPASSLAGVVLVPTLPFPAGTGFRAQIVDTTSSTYGSALGLPCFVGQPPSSVSTPTPFSPCSPVTGAPLTQLTPGDTYWVSINRN